MTYRAISNRPFPLQLNPLNTPRTLTLTVTGPAGERYTPAGLGQPIALEADGRQKSRFALTLSAQHAATALPLTFRLIDPKGAEAASARLTLPPLESPGVP